MAQPTIEYWRNKAREMVALYGPEDAAGYFRDILREEKNAEDKKALERIVKGIENGTIRVSERKRAMIFRRESEL